MVAVMAEFAGDDTDCDAGERDSARMVKLIVAVAVPVPEPVAVIVTAESDWAVVGVPDTTPVDALSDSPAGSAPDVSVYVTAPTTPLVVNAVVAVRAVFTAPVTAWVAGESEAPATVMLIVAVAVSGVPAVESVAVMVTLAAP